MGVEECTYKIRWVCKDDCWVLCGDDSTTAHESLDDAMRAVAERFEHDHGVEIAVTVEQRVEGL